MARRAAAARRGAGAPARRGVRRHCDLPHRGRPTLMALSRSKVLLGIVLAIALAVRLRGIWFGLPFVHARPDELLIVGTALEFFTKGLHPRFFDYPSLF